MPLPNNLGQLPGEDYNLLQSRLDKFESAWKHTDSVDLTAYLPPPSNPLRAVYLRELVKSDLEARWRRKQPVLLDYYLEKFPELGDRDTVDLALIVEEFHIRQRLGDKPPLASYERRFPKHFEELKRLLQITPGTAQGLDQTVAPHASDDHNPPPARPGPVWMLGEMSNTYKLIKRLGSGAFAEVWLAEAPGGVKVAVKRLLHVMEKDVAQRELDSLERTKNLMNPFLLQTHAFWLADDRLHIAMELADGTLRDKFRECQQKDLKGIPRDELIRYFRQAAEGLDYLHKEKIVHRDIKPENILLRAGYAKVADFGLARALHSQRMSSSNAAGTLLYMAPEVWGKKVGPANDLYSLALTYAELLMGYHPYDKQAKAGGVYGVMLAHLNEEPDLSELPESDRAVVMRALAKDPSHRFSDCLSFVEALGQVAMPRIVAPPPKREGLGMSYDLLSPLGNAIRGITLKALAPDGKLALVNRIVLREDYRLNKHELETFAQLIRLQHPNLLPLQACWVADRDNQLLWAVNRQGMVVQKDLPATLSGGTINLAMDLLTETLARRLEQSSQDRPGLPPGTALDYLKQAASALDFLNGPHQVNRKTVFFRHCAVSPESLLVDAQGVHLGDLSLVQMVDGPDAALPAHLGGFSPTYSAPELFDNRIYDTSDQYSLVILYYYLRTGQLPFEPDASPQRRIDLHRSGKLDFQFVPPPEQKVLARGAKRAPGERFPTCMALVEALSDAQLEASPYDTLQPGQGSGIRKPIPAPAVPSEVNRTQNFVNSMTVDPNTTWDINVQPPSPFEATMGELKPASIPELAIEPPKAKAAPVKEATKPEKTTKKAPKIAVGGRLPEETATPPELKPGETVKDVTKQARRTMKMPSDIAPKADQSWKQGKKKGAAKRPPKTIALTITITISVLSVAIAAGVFFATRSNGPPGPTDLVKIGTTDSGTVSNVSGPTESGHSSTTNPIQPPPRSGGTSGGSTRPIPPDTHPVPGQSPEEKQKRDLGNRLSNGESLLANGADFSKAREMFEQVKLASQSPGLDAVRYQAYLGLGRASVGQQDWNSVRQCADVLAKCESDPEARKYSPPLLRPYLPYLRLMADIHPLADNTDGLEKALKALTDFHNDDNLFEKLETKWEKDRIKSEAVQAVQVALNRMKDAPIPEARRLLDVVCGWDPKSSTATREDWSQELNALVVAEDARKDESKRPQALTSLSALFGTRQTFHRSTGELVRAYAGLALLADERDCRKAVDALGTLGNERLKKEGVLPEYYRLLTREITFLYPSAQDSDAFRPILSFCGKFAAEDAAGLVLACKAEALLVISNDVKKAREAAWGKDVNKAGAYGAFVQGRVLTEERKTKEAADAFDSAKLGAEKADWQNKARCDLAARVYFEAGQELADGSAEKVRRYQRAIALVSQHQGTIKPEYRLALARAAMKVQPPESKVAEAEAVELLKDADFLKRPADVYQVRLLHTDALTQLQNYGGAVQEYQTLLTAYLDSKPREDGSGPKDYEEIYEHIVQKAVAAAEEWQKQDSKDPQRKLTLAQLYAEKGHFLYANYLEFGDQSAEKHPLVQALAAYEGAAREHEKDDTLRAEYLTWQGYLLTQQGTRVDDKVIEKMKEIARKAETADKNYSGAHFVMGLALHYQADNYLKQGETEKLDEFEAQAVKDLTIAIENGKDSPLLDLYYETSSAAHLVLGNRLMSRENNDPKVLRKELEIARDHAQACLKHSPRYPWHAHYTSALALEDIAWLCAKDDSEKVELYRGAVNEYGEADSTRHGDPSILVGRGRAQLRWATTTTPVNRDLLTKARADLEVARTRAQQKKDAYYTSESRIWLANTHLELGNFDKVSEFLKPEIRAAADVWWPTITGILENEIRLGWTRDKKDAAVLFQAVLDQCEDFALRAKDLTARERPKAGKRCTLQGLLYTAQAHEGLADQLDSASPKALEHWTAAKKICDQAAEQQEELETLEPARFIELLLLRSRILLASPELLKVDLEKESPRCINDCTLAIQLVKKHQLGNALLLKAYSQRGPARLFKLGGREKIKQPDVAAADIAPIYTDFEQALQLDEEAVTATKRKPNKLAWSWRMEAGYCRVVVWAKGENKDEEMRTKALDHLKKALKDPNTPKDRKPELINMIDFVDPK